MASVEQRLVPDEGILSDIFPGVIGLKPTIYDTSGTCVFRIQLPENGCLPEYPRDLVVRLDTSIGRLHTAAALQHLGHSQLGELVPPVLHTGTTTTGSKPVDYLVTAYLPGTILEDVWDTLDQSHQIELVDSAVRIVEKLQKLDLSSLGQSLVGTYYTSTTDGSIPIGGLALGYFSDIRQFLGGIVHAGNQKNSQYKLSEIDGGIAVQSGYEDIGQVHFSESDLNDIHRHVVFCHNDIEPRNIIVREVSSGKYELTGLIDWDQAGFFPFSYESGYKDTILGRSNLSFSWYSLFKNKTTHLLPRAEGHTKIIQVLRIIEESGKRLMRRNVGIRVQKKWLEREQLEEASDIRQGWVRKAGAKAPEVFTKKDLDILQVIVLKELGHVQIGDKMWARS